MSLASYFYPDEGVPHEGTWLQWPHHHQYGLKYRNQLDYTWIELTRLLAISENVHIIVYDESEKSRISELLKFSFIDDANIDFWVYQTDDFWVRDNGPIFVFDEHNDLVILDWGFNGWGGKAAYSKCNKIPKKIAADLDLRVVDLNTQLIVEGGGIEVDGNGTLMACRSSILNSNRNPSLSQSEVEAILKQYLGVVNFVWLDGKKGREITDQHIDGFARFGDARTIITMNNDDLLEYDVAQSDIDRLFSARDKHNQPYDFVTLPLSQNPVVTTYGKNLNYKGSYCNFYLANEQVIVPTYNDPNDRVALEKLRLFFKNRVVKGIDFRNAYAHGGMVHCVTQQQPKTR